MKPYLICELSCNHLGSIDRALRIIDAAAEAGADAAKFQVWTSDLMVVADRTIKSGPWAGRKLADLYHEAWTPTEWLPRLAEHAKRAGLNWFASVFDIQALERVVALDPKYLKIASCELVDIPLIRAVAATGKPMILSTGMGEAGEVHAAWQAALASPQVTLLHCVSGYPTPAAEANLYRIKLLRAAYGPNVGLSLHSLEPAVAIAAVALGATMVEAHLTLSRADGGPDATFSYEQAEFAKLVADCRMAAEACADRGSNPMPSEVPQRALRRSLWWARNLPRGHIVLEGDLVSARPADGLAPKERDKVVGAYLSRDVTRGEPVALADIDVTSTWDKLYG